MIFAVLICISLVLLGVCWIAYRRNTELFLCILIALYFELFYLAPIIHGSNDYKLLLLPILLILLVESFLARKLALGRYGWWVISFFGISFLSVIAAFFSGQSLELGIKAAKYVPFMLVYFLVAGRRIDANKFAIYFIFMALGVATVATLQYFLRSGVNIFIGMPQYMKLALLEHPRVTIGQFVISVAAVVSFARYMQISRWYYLLASFLLFLEVLFIQQTRAFIAGIFISIIIVYFLSRKLTMLRVSTYLILLGVFFSIFLVAGSDIYNVELVKRTGSDIAERKGSYHGRIYAYNHYWKEIEKKPFFGHGLLNYNWQNNPEKYLRSKGIHFSDIGIVHWIVQAGFIAFIWLIYGLLKIWSDIVSFPDQLIASSYFILATLTMPTIDMLLRDDSMFLFATFLGIFSSTIQVSQYNKSNIVA